MTSSERRRAGRGRARALAAPTILLTVVGSLAACTGHDDKPAGSAAPASSTPVANARLEVRSGVTRVVGEMAPGARKHLAAKVAALVGDYFRAAFLAPHRGGGAASFPGFTPEARTLAEHDRQVTTGAAYAGADRISPRNGTAYVNVLAPHGHVVGATVRVGLGLSVTRSGDTRPVTVSGRLLLTPTPGGWRIFGYDLSQSGRHARSTP